MSIITGDFRDGFILEIHVPMVMPETNIFFYSLIINLILFYLFLCDKKRKFLN